MLRFTWLVGAFAALHSLIIAQTCVVPTPLDHELDPVWGGETWTTFSDDSGGSLRIWTGEDGGRIRTSHDGGLTWVFADTPDDYTHTVLDIWFLPGGIEGYATGRGGRVLYTDDGGLSWSYYGVPVFDAENNPATLWGVRSLDKETVIVSGLWTFEYTTDSGLTWGPITVYDLHPSDSNAAVIPNSDLELFRLDVIDPGSTFVGCVGAKWEEPVVGDHGVVLRTDSTDPYSSQGWSWWIVLDDGETRPSQIGAVMLEPWAVRFERGSTSTTDSVAYVCGGPSGNNPSRHYRSIDSGETWSLGGDLDVTPYDVTAHLGGDAMIVGYSGTYWLRDAQTGAWTQGVMPAMSSGQPSPGKATGALEGASSFGTQGFIATGDFGIQRISHDGGATWSSMSDFYPGDDELEARIRDCAFQPGAPLTGCLVGQLGRVLYTTDGGCTLTEVTVTPKPNSLNAVEFENSTFGVAVGDAGELLRSVDGGQTWYHGSFMPSTQFPAGLTDQNITFRDVATSNATSAWAVGNFNTGAPAVAYSADSGLSWELMAVPPGNITLESIAFGGSSAGLVVGHSSPSSGGPVPEAFLVTFGAGVLTWTDLGVTGISGRLMRVATSDSPLSLAVGIAVGDNGLVMEWDAATQSMVQVSPMTAIDLTSVDVSPSGGTVLIGGKYDNDLSTANDKGYLLRRAGGAWTSIRALTGKDIRGISLTGDSEGFVLGQTEGNSHSFINGNLTSSVLLHYEAN